MSGPTSAIFRPLKASKNQIEMKKYDSPRHLKSAIFFGYSFKKKHLGLSYFLISFWVLEDFNGNIYVFFFI